MLLYGRMCRLMGRPTRRERGAEKRSFSAVPSNEGLSISYTCTNTAATNTSTFATQFLTRAGLNERTM